jgi:hypothetical protein
MKTPTAGNQIGEQIATFTVWTLAIMIVGTPIGLWIRLFWLGWVLQICQ